MQIKLFFAGRLVLQQRLEVNSEVAYGWRYLNNDREFSREKCEQCRRFIQKLSKS